MKKLRLILICFLLMVMMFNHACVPFMFEDYQDITFHPLFETNKSEQDLSPKPKPKLNIIFSPFFKTEKSEQDLPSKPQLNKFDNAVLKVCGNWGDVLRSNAFISVLNDSQYSDEVNSMYNSLNHQVITANADIAIFKKELAMVWFGHNAFRHIFCGEPGKNKLGGMHFVGRYLQAQENQWAGMTQNKTCPKKEIEPPIYTIGVDFLNSTGKVKTKCKDGYDYEWHAKDMLVLATKALKDFKSEVQGMCLYDLPGGKKAVFVKKNDKAIATFYPTLSPRCSRSNCDCK